MRLHTEAKSSKKAGNRLSVKPSGLAFLAYPRDRAAYGRLCRLISAGRMATLDGKWQAKGECDISLAMLAEHSEDVHLILLPPRDLDQRFAIEVPSNVIPFRRPSLRAEEEITTPDQVRGDEKMEFEGTLGDALAYLAEQIPSLRHLAASFLYTANDIARIERLDALARATGLALLATNEVHYHVPERRPLQDVMTAIRHKTPSRSCHARACRSASQTPAEMIEPCPCACYFGRPGVVMPDFNLDE